MSQFVALCGQMTVPACQNLYKNSFTYYCLPDDKSLPFDDAIQFLEQCEKDKARVLVHCMSGKNRLRWAIFVTPFIDGGSLHLGFRLGLQLQKECDVVLLLEVLGIAKGKGIAGFTGVKK
ncbi:Protein-tyrosine-phosphatase IBR5 [Vitis vinifera]|uniref:Protein-tyrosine-phosphatase IBR5 n=1 Tax=Vitis vinifera TaxID=29760 RepID=A0A438BQU2_VITVI|nr:Protein-tyrosine-phosphatase IBR5 [Vitis vinifera]